MMVLVAVMLSVCMMLMMALKAVVILVMMFARSFSMAAPLSIIFL